MNKLGGLVAVAAVITMAATASCTASGPATSSGTTPATTTTSSSAPVSTTTSSTPYEFPPGPTTDAPLAPTRSAAEERYLAAYLKTSEGSDCDGYCQIDALTQAAETCQGYSGLSTDEAARRLFAVDSYLTEPGSAYLLPLTTLCPQHGAAIAVFRSGFRDANWTVGSGQGQVKPGTYRTAPGVTDCYWERVTGSGGTIANDFVTSAPQGVTVRIRSTDGGFTSRGCGEWLPA